MSAARFKAGSFSLPGFWLHPSKRFDQMPQPGTERPFPPRNQHPIIILKSLAFSYGLPGTKVFVPGASSWKLRERPPLKMPSHAPDPTGAFTCAGLQQACSCLNKVCQPTINQKDDYNEQNRRLEQGPQRTRKSDKEGQEYQGFRLLERIVVTNFVIAFRAVGRPAMERKS